MRLSEGVQGVQRARCRRGGRCCAARRRKRAEPPPSPRHTGPCLQDRDHQPGRARCLPAGAGGLQPAGQRKPAGGGAGGGWARAASLLVVVTQALSPGGRWRGLLHALRVAGWRHPRWQGTRAGEGCAWPLRVSPASRHVDSAPLPPAPPRCPLQAVETAVETALLDRSFDIRANVGAASAGRCRAAAAGRHGASSTHAPYLTQLPPCLLCCSSIPLSLSLE